MAQKYQVEINKEQIEESVNNIIVFIENGNQDSFSREELKARYFFAMRLMGMIPTTKYGKRLLIVSPVVANKTIDRLDVLLKERWKKLRDEK